MALTDAQARLLASEYRTAMVALENARETFREKERTLAQAIYQEPGRVLVIGGWRLSSDDGVKVIATRERVVA